MSVIRNGRNHAVPHSGITHRQAEKTRNAIDTTLLMGLLERNALGTLVKPNLKFVPDPGAPYELSASQVKSAQICLDKAMPNLQALEVTDRGDSPEHTPEELRLMLKNVLLAMPRDEVMKMLEDREPALIEG